MTSTGCLIISNKKYDLIREKFREEWDNRDISVWHREYKDYKDVICRYKNESVIVVASSPQWTHYNYNANSNVILIPFIYKGIPIRIWKL